MAPTKLTWEEVQKYPRVDRKYNIYEHNGKLYYATDEGGIVSKIVVYQLPNEYFQLLKDGKRSMSDIGFKLQNDRWPPSEEEKVANRKKWIIKKPTTLIGNPSSQKIFTNDELKRLIPIAEKTWIEYEGQLPDNYTSPFEK